MTLYSTRDSYMMKREVQHLVKKAFPGAATFKITPPR